MKRPLAVFFVLLVAACAPEPPRTATVKPGWQWTTDSVFRVTNAARCGEPTIGALSQGQYGGRVGLDRVLGLLDRYQIPATFFIPAVSLMITPDMADRIQRSRRHEFGGHGWIHEMNVSLPRDVERRLLQQAIDTLTRLPGERPVGYRAPSWNFSPNTLSIIKELGFLYESSMMADDRPS